MKRFPAGRLGDDPSIGLSASLSAAGFKLGRLQTGTPARLDRNTINFKNLAVQPGDLAPSPFGFLHDSVDNAVRLAATDIRHPTNLICVGQPSFVLSNAYHARDPSSCKG